MHVSANWVMMENIEDSWFLRWDEEDVDLRKEREKLEDSGKKEIMRKVLIRVALGQHVSRGTSGKEVVATLHGRRGSSPRLALFQHSGYLGSLGAATWVRRA